MLSLFNHDEQTGKVSDASRVGVSKLDPSGEGVCGRACHSVAGAIFYSDSEMNPHL